MASKTVAEVIEVMSKPGGCVSNRIAECLDRKDEIDEDCNTMPCYDCDSKWFGIFSDMVEREKAEAVSAAMEFTLAEHMRAWAYDLGLPAFKEGEGLQQWLDRCFLPRPLFEDGEPIQFGDEPYLLETIDQISFFQDGSVTIGHDGNTFSVDPCERVARPKVLDSQHRIYSDALLESSEYWKCEEVGSCSDCPSIKDGMAPNIRYGCSDCITAMTLDLLRRQRELDARKGGE